MKRWQRFFRRFNTLWKQGWRFNWKLQLVAPCGEERMCLSAVRWMTDEDFRWYSGT